MVGQKALVARQRSFLSLSLSSHWLCAFEAWWSLNKRTIQICFLACLGSEGSMIASRLSFSLWHLSLTSQSQHTHLQHTSKQATTKGRATKPGKQCEGVSIHRHQEMLRQRNLPPNPPPLSLSLHNCACTADSSCTPGAPLPGVGLSSTLDTRMDSCRRFSAEARPDIV